MPLEPNGNVLKLFASLHYSEHGLFPPPGALQSKEIEFLVQSQATWHSGLVYETYKLRGLVRLWSPKFFPPLRMYSKCSRHVAFQLHLACFSSSNVLAWLPSSQASSTCCSFCLEPLSSYTCFSSRLYHHSLREVPLPFCHSIWVMLRIEFYPEFNSCS